MLKVLRQAINRLSFSHQFLLAIVTVLTIGMLVIGSWISHLIETNAVNRTAAISAVYLESMSVAQLHDWPHNGVLDDATHEELDQIFVDGPLRRAVLRFKLWDASGRIVYSNDHAQIGHVFPVKGRLADAFTGTIQAQISNLKEIDNLPEEISWNQLLEIYVPVRSTSDGRIFAVAEFYLSVVNLRKEILAAQQRSWGLVALSTVAVYLLLYGLVRRANNTINEQQRDLRNQLQRLHSVLDENDRMREQLREAGLSTTALNEEFLLRIAADLHDGPAQTIAFALMRFDEFAVTCHGCISSEGETPRELGSIQSALQSSLRDVRKISSGLAVPGMSELSLSDTARRAVRDFERQTGQTVQTEIDEALGKAPLAVKITVYRLLQESLTNCWRHAPGGSPQVRVKKHDREVVLTITDHGAGVDPQAAAIGGRLGLAFMRERVRLLGGIFEIDSAPGRGTRISARLPLSTDEVIHV